MIKQERDVRYCNHEDEFEDSKGFTYSLKEGDIADNDYVETIKSFINGLYDDEGEITPEGSKMLVFIETKKMSLGDGWKLSKNLSSNPDYIVVSNSDGEEVRMLVKNIKKIKVEPELK